MATAAYDMISAIPPGNSIPCGVTTVENGDQLGTLTVQEGTYKVVWIAEMVARGFFVLVDITDPEEEEETNWEVRSAPTNASLGIDPFSGHREFLTYDGVNEVPNDTLYAMIDLWVSYPIQFVLRAILDQRIEFVNLG